MGDEEEKTGMRSKSGLGVSPGITVAQTVIIDNEEFDIPERHVPIDHAQLEMDRFSNAVKVSMDEIADLKSQSVKKIGKEAASIFDFHIGLLGDNTLSEKIERLIREGHVTAEYAVAKILRAYAREYSEMPDYFAERSRDVYDVEKRLLTNLTGQKRESLAHLTRDVVIVAYDLNPSQTAGLDRNHVVGLATDLGGATSHTAIMARALGIPAVLGLEDITTTIEGGETVILDGFKGILIINPDEKTIERYRKLDRQQEEFIHSLDALANLPAVTKDGCEIELQGNIEFPSDARTVLNKGGTGIGLYRTEFLFLESNSEPDEDAQYAAYREVLAVFGDLPVTIRTADLGADKFIDARPRVPERNPALGCRSIRYCLSNTPIFKRQLRAIYRAGVHGNPRVMFPLITNITELRQAKSIVWEVLEDLEEEGVEHTREIPLGVMIEVPAAALQAEVLAAEVDFFSIGTNDLVQYTLAVDRTNERVASLFTAAHPAVLELIQRVVKAGKKNKIPVGLCGKIAGDPEYTLLLVGLGLKQFSCVPQMIPEIKKIIRSVTLRQARDVARQARKFGTVTEITGYLRKVTRKILPELYE